MQPLYTPDNTTAAYQLNWSVALFGTDEFPPAANWLSELKAVAESDGVRILEHHIAAANEESQKVAGTDSIEIGMFGSQYLAE